MDVGTDTFILQPREAPGEEMPDAVTVATTDDLASGEGMAVSVDPGDGEGRVGIALFNVDGEYRAIENRCTHVGGSLGNGRVSGTTVACPLHGVTLDVTTGEVPSPPADEPIPFQRTRWPG